MSERVSGFWESRNGGGGSGQRLPATAQARWFCQNTGNQSRVDKPGLPFCLRHGICTAGQHCCCCTAGSNPSVFIQVPAVSRHQFRTCKPLGRPGQRLPATAQVGLVGLFVQSASHRLSRKQNTAVGGWLNTLGAPECNYSWHAVLKQRLCFHFSACHCPDELGCAFISVSSHHTRVASVPCL